MGMYDGVVCMYDWHPQPHPTPPTQRKLVVLGGAFHVSGNVNPAAEANIYGDPEAADYVLGHGGTVHMVGLNVTHECILSSERLEGMRGKGRFGSFLADATRFYVAYHRCVCVCVWWWWWWCSVIMFQHYMQTRIRNTTSMYAHITHTTPTHHLDAFIPPPHTTHIPHNHPPPPTTTQIITHTSHTGKPTRWTQHFATTPLPS